MTTEKIERDRTAGTPGPWRVGPVDDTVVIAPDGSEVAADVVRFRALDDVRHMICQEIEARNER